MFGFGSWTDSLVNWNAVYVPVLAVPPPLEALALPEELAAFDALGDDADPLEALDELPADEFEFVFVPLGDDADPLEALDELPAEEFEFVFAPPLKLLALLLLGVDALEPLAEFEVLLAGVDEFEPALFELLEFVD